MLSDCAMWLFLMMSVGSGYMNCCFFQMNDLLSGGHLSWCEHACRDWCMSVRQRVWSTWAQLGHSRPCCICVHPHGTRFPQSGSVAADDRSMVCVCASLFAVVVSIRMLQVATETELISRSETFEQAMKDNALAQFCDYKVSGSEGEDQETWLYLRILFEADPKRYQAPSQDSFDTPGSIHHLAVLPDTMTS